MKFVEVTPDKVKIPRPRNNLAKFINEFRDSGVKVAKLEEWHYANSRVGMRTINVASKKCKAFPAIRAFTRGNDIYIVNEV